MDRVVLKWGGGQRGRVEQSEISQSPVKAISPGSGDFYYKERLGVSLRRDVVFEQSMLRQPHHASVTMSLERVFRMLV